DHVAERRQCRMGWHQARRIGENLGRCLQARDQHPVHREQIADDEGHADRAAQPGDAVRAQQVAQAPDHSCASRRSVRTYRNATASTMMKEKLPTAAPMPKWKRWNES